MSRMLGQDPLRDTTGPRLSLPFLPTLVTAMLIGASSLLCRGPATPPPALRVDAQAFAPAAAHVPSTPARAPAALIFAEHFPVTSGATGELPVAARPVPAPRVAVAPVRRPVAAQAPARRPEVVVARAAERVREPLPEPLAEPAPAPVAISQPWLVPPAAIPDVEAEEEGLPGLALPFAPAAHAVGEAVGYVRGRAAALGGSVSIFVDRMR